LKEVNLVEPVQKKSLWKKYVAWGIGIILVLMVVAKIMSGSVETSAGIDKEFYKNALKAFNQLNVAYEKGEPDDKTATAWLDEQFSMLEKNRSAFSDMENEVIMGEREMMAAVALIVFDRKGIQPLDENSRRNVVENYGKARVKVANLLGVKGDSSSVELSVPDGMDSDLYKKSLTAFHELNDAYKNGSIPSEEVRSWLYYHGKILESSSGTDKYSPQEKEVLDILVNFAINIANFQTNEAIDLENMINYGRSRLSELLNVSEDY